MNTYLLAWSSKRWKWDDLVEMSDDVKEGKPTIIRWSCGKSRRIKIGDRIFLIRLGDEPKGIFASGTVTEGSYEDLHWEDVKATMGETSFFIQAKLDVLLNPNIDMILPRELLNSPPFSAMHWDTQMSGVRIPEKVAKELEKAWIDISQVGSSLFPEEVKDYGTIYEGALHRISVNAYERNPEARRKCISHYGPTCFICGFDFIKTYGEVGRGFIHVHHLQQISEIGKEFQIDPIVDLRPVCPNCHAIIHRRKPAYSVDEVRSFLQRK